MRRTVASELEHSGCGIAPSVLSGLKDENLDRLAESVNVAQFVSFDPNLKQRFVRVKGILPQDRFNSPEKALKALIEASRAQRVNIRSFSRDSPKGGEFIYDLKETTRVVAELQRLAQNGLYTIVNETIDIADGGVSGVVLGGTIEFAPDDTPRCVEKPDVLSIDRDLGLVLLETVYHFKPGLKFADSNWRVEFSIHPLRCGVHHEHTIIWEVELDDPTHFDTQLRWPNKFSRLIGDKAFGLLVAHHVGLPVPKTTVIARRIPPFTFGRSTGSGETWLRTCPTQQIPGYYPTFLGWQDPGRLLADIDPSGANLASILAQEAVEPAFSGALVPTVDNSPLVEGVRGRGDDFMLGRRPPERLPRTIVSSVESIYQAAIRSLGPVRMEWVHDGHEPWIIQLHTDYSPSTGDTVFPGTPESWIRFQVTTGLEALRELVAQVGGRHVGVVLVGSIGVTSHMGDILRHAKIPSRIERSDA